MNKKGFTLIELVIVIVILGILAAVAVPKFINLQSDAKKAAVSGLGGAVKSAANLVKARWMVDGGTSDNVTIEGKTVNVLGGTGYPDATANGIGSAVDYDNETFVFTNSGGATGTATFLYDNTSNCGVKYEVNSSDNTTTVTILTDGC
ncbi:type II secretion system protein [Deferribacter autotrophicus]|uniref:Type II secretion system protein n=1 Tax=Deferribacter autotrophicus TaxID=500465 RepID=A0A5A8F1R7_9BACT|nr:type II secretion system protein [Deferribacter autotrophicus]KAA0257367.1 type II secretion system protein [Deferribacter autotrophicus]